uniref:Reverse transcriptase domain-containing protein n=1 Tax=Tanacetum cinerariifolium TaxID=118510 RepID=A0A6L2K835_TANCI|nr:reverse transcriptase domain-containing protein [Tanacetum cinerariifolium]
MQSPSGLGSLPSNTIANPRSDVKAITTRSGVAYEGPTILPTSSSLLKEVERETEATKDKSNVEVPSNLSKLHFDLSFADALLHIPKFASTFKSLLSNKEKLFELENTPLTKNFSAVLLKKLPEKLEDPGRFLIPCDFQGLESCMALADLGASINLMPLSVWMELSLPDLTPTCMTFELATRSITYPVGMANDVFVQVGKFTFLADFVVVDYEVDPCVPLILGRPFLKTVRALVDVYGEELILRVGDEKLIFHADSTLKHPHKHGNESVNMINFIDITCEDHFPEVLKFKKSDHPSSGSTTPLSDSSPSLTPFKTSDSLLEEKIKYLLNQDPSTESNIETIDPILKKFTDEPALDYLPLPGDADDDDDDLFDLKSDNDEWKKLLYGDCYKDIDFEKDKNKDSKMKLLIVEDHIVESNVLISQSLDSNSTLPEESSEIATLSSSPFRNEDTVFNLGIHILGRTQIVKDESKDKDLFLEERNFLSISYDKELLFFLELTVIETLLSFSSENEEKVFNPGILTSKGVHYLTLELSHQTYETFKIINIHSNIFNEGPMKIFPFFCFCLKDKGIREIPYGESKVHIEVLLVLWENRLPIRTIRGRCLGFPAQSIRSSNMIALDSSYLLVLITGTSQSRQHGKSESDSYYLSD